VFPSSAAADGAEYGAARVSSGPERVPGGPGGGATHGQAYSVEVAGRPQRSGRPVEGALSQHRTSRRDGRGYTQCAAAERSRLWWAIRSPGRC